ncbi:YggS family pyridoxal phosphate-dependent enzyme [Nitrospina watsonii]|uniref:Pyridoxal phosphate homeostasis protein n=1 Tax=Nitrospina watsonii TaxID=1323948 RepID=A0ABM9HCA7_9BACT|nr:YggS family pyridoxal phosphate-dependent enzyme [Nitrospina watsonii]CAI2717726.1 Pyridoxal phosphate homeostasis protein [Nitrospina watsonii]
MSTLSDNLESICQRIRNAALKAGRDPESVRLVAVSKTVPEDRIQEAQAAGVHVFGENKVQEALRKIEQLGHDGYGWHFIGHLQKNKVKYVSGQFERVHSVDSAGLAEKLSAQSQEQGVVTAVLVQVNVSGEASKFGVEPDALEDLLMKAGHLPGIAVKGLMTIPPFSENAEASRKYFAALRAMRDRLQARNLPGISLDELSMGMSHDFEIAIEEGATWVRVGTALFGQRVQ